MIGWMRYYKDYTSLPNVPIYEQLYLEDGFILELD